MSVLLDLVSLEGCWRSSLTGCHAYSGLTNLAQLRTTKPEVVRGWRADLEREIAPFRVQLSHHWEHAGSWAYLVELNSRFTISSLPWRPICHPPGPHPVEDECSLRGRPTLREMYKLLDLNERGLLTLDAHSPQLEREEVVDPPGTVSSVSSRRPSLQLLCPTAPGTLGRDAWVAELVARVDAAGLFVFVDAYAPSDRAAVAAAQGCRLPATNFPRGWCSSGLVVGGPTPLGAVAVPGVAVPSHEEALRNDLLARWTCGDLGQAYTLESLGMGRYPTLEAARPVLVMVVGQCPWTKEELAEQDLVLRLRPMLEEMGIGRKYIM